MTARDLKANIQALSLELSGKDGEIQKLLSSLTNSRNQSFTGNLHSATTTTGPTAEDQRVRALEEELEEKRATTSQLQHELSITKESLVEVESMLEQLQASPVLPHQEVQRLQAQLEASWRARTLEQKALRDCSDERDVKEEENARLRKELQQAEAALASYRTRFQEEFKERRRLHNVVMELRGNIRVFCRIRPPMDVHTSGRSPVRGACDQRLQIVRKDPGIGGGDVTVEFEFDEVFEPDSTNSSVYEHVAPLVRSVLDGYNVCIFAYGQTGSGKGPMDDQGVTYRAVQTLFAQAAARPDTQLCVRVSMVQIYNEAVYDLLAAPTADEFDLPHKLDIQRAPDACPWQAIPDLTVRMVVTPAEVFAVLDEGNSGRAVASTLSNEFSSRSHSIASVYVTCTDTGSDHRTSSHAAASSTSTPTSVTSILHLVDLAGSERIKKSGSTGEQLKEAQAINKSLSALGDVLAALRRPAIKAPQHVPYRNSKLTRLLESSLSNGSKALLFVNVTPDAAHLNETVSSATFASRARAVELGAAKKVRADVPASPPTQPYPTQQQSASKLRRPQSGRSPSAGASPTRPQFVTK